MGFGTPGVSMNGSGLNSPEPSRYISLDRIKSFRLIVILNVLMDILLNDLFKKEQCERKSMEKSNHSDPNTAKDGQRMTADDTSELLSYISEATTSLTETLHSLDSFETYVQSPSKEPVEPLKLANEKNTGLAQEKLHKVLDFVVNECQFQDADNESRGSQDFDEESSSSGTCAMQLDPQLDSMSSISDEAGRRDQLGKERNPLSPKFENREENFDTNSEEENRMQQWNNNEDSSVEEVIVFLRSLKVQDVDVEAKLDVLKNKIHSQQKQVESLKFEKQEILAELGEIFVKNSAKESEERKSQYFYRIFCPPSKAERNVVSICGDTSAEHLLGYPNVCKSGYQISAHENCIGSMSNGSQNGLQKPQTMKERNRQPGKVNMKTRAKDESEFQERDQDNPNASSNRNDSGSQNLATQNVSSILLRGKTSGGEGTKSRRNKVNNGTSDAASTSRDEENLQSGSTRQSYEGLPFSVQQDDSNGKESISLGSKPPTSVASTLYNNYKLLLLTLGQSLLSSDVVALKNWANQNFSIENAQNATDVLFQLDEKRVINAEDLSPLHHFFESIIRIDLVYIIDAFLLGDYSPLRLNPASKNRGAGRAQNSQHGGPSRYSSIFNAANSRRSSASDTVVDPATSRKPQNSNRPFSSADQQTQQAAFPSFSELSNPTNPKLFSRSPNENQSHAHVQQNLKPFATGFTPARVADVVVGDGLVINERRTMTANSSTRTNQSMTTNARNTQTAGSNGSKLSKFQRPDAQRNNGSNSQSPGTSRNQQALDQDGNWLCSHYKRHCYVKFECCNKFWPCHRCHNNQSTCGRKKLKSRDTQRVKCVYCNKEQQFGEFCCDCGAKFASYFCGLCKHLTGNDDHPYHCEKCGICRIHGDRSFHCDICGVCLDVQLRGNHRCREGSAHDECCICLEDAFTGCQILPCSHKVHKECATQMIRSGITRCPICRESFAHKLERRQLPNSRKHSGK